MPCKILAVHNGRTFKKDLVHSEVQNAQLFKFGTINRNSKGVLITSPVNYNSNVGYGFDYDTAENVTINAIYFLTKKPTYFSVKLPEGNYQVEVTLGSDEAASNVTIKAESRRLMLQEQVVQKGKQFTKTFNVNVRNSKIDATTSMSLRSSENDDLNWDDKLTLEFLGIVAVQSIKITPIDNATVVYLAGDSTVTDQDVEPWASWGQFITNYFDDKVVIANYAVSGSALNSFKGGRRLKKILSVIKPRDYLIIEFAHNDEKVKGEGNGAWGSYSDLLTEYVQLAREKGAIPILNTPTQRRAFNGDGTLKPTHGDFPDAVRAVAKKLNVPLIDVTKMTTQMYESWGDEPSRKAFVQYPANTFPGQDKALEDNTHFNSFGANEIALGVVEGIKKLDIPLKKCLIKETPSYNPAKPHAFSNWTLPMSTRFEIVKPEGN
ncbi:rhamnogalacturonan acetylesterase [Flavobacterium cellulosilyticum]|uniref:Rhamnogalacturonan acetylesterase n=1 Tax=Flavobacterium cellulosilyticum TaxID=2541731 RepID=A0A4R5CAH5_9FLAO|nr:rhamnogalacturonan acetylesterase [Flavobacterium cellulosilyticum]TDD95706.1 rhamnogalacturonan acetylesterase [Flavobacterium cellulosilyticum]